MSYTTSLPRLWTCYRLLAGAATTAAVSSHQQYFSKCDFDRDCGVEFDSAHSIVNWSGTHLSHPDRIYYPNSAQEVVRVLQHYNNVAMHSNDKNIKLRPVGTALSPNGIGLSINDAKGEAHRGLGNNNRNNSINVSHLDSIAVNVKEQEVTVGAGARVSSILSELSKHGLTLSNFSSIQEQQMGGWSQVSAHGTGCKLATVDDMIVRMQIATPTEGLITLSKFQNPHLFEFAKVGLGCLGVVTELTLQCMPQIKLHETTTTFTRQNISVCHVDRLKNFRHVRYMWIPYTNTVVSVVSNETNEDLKASTASQLATEPLAELVWDLKLLPNENRTTINNLSFSQLRDVLLDSGPLDVEHIKRVNAAEAEFWKRSCGERVDDSTKVLGFDCGGQQLVFEVCFPIGKLEDATCKDLEFMAKLLAILEKEGLPAPSPIEQRWTARSTAPMSPAYSNDKDDVFSWVGIIMYLPPGQSSSGRADITHKFDEYCALIEPLLEEFDARIHWAKIELPGRGLQNASDTQGRLGKLRNRLQQHYPVGQFNSFRRAIDPNNLLGNYLIDSLLTDASYK